MIKGIIKKHRWFMRETPKYIGYSEFYKVSTIRFLRAWFRFMWASRKDNHEYYS